MTTLEITVLGLIFGISVGFVFGFLIAFLVIWAASRKRHPTPGAR